MLDISSPDLLRLLVEHASRSVAVFDREMRYLAANDHHLVAYGLVGEGDVIGACHYDLVRAVPERWRECHRACLEGNLEVCSGEAVVALENGNGKGRRQLCWEMHPWRDSSGEIGGVVVFTQTFPAEQGVGAQCISERLSQAEAEVRRARQELAIARAEAQEASRVKSSFLSTMSHELRTPLSSILLFCEMMQEDALAEGNQPLADDLARVVGAGLQLRALIDDLLEFAKLEAGRTRVEATPFDAADLIRSTAAAMRPLVDKTGNTLEVRLTGELGVVVADPAKLRQCLINLLSNACKFTDHGRILLEASRKVDPSDSQEEWLVIRVLDTGIGISREVLPRLFQDFVQGDPSLTRKYGGTGLGLAMTRRYVEMMGGTVSAESEPGRGAVFTIRLPVDVTRAAGEGAAA